MKKKLSFTVVLALILALVAVTALGAVVYNAFYERVAQIDYSGDAGKSLLDRDTVNLIAIVDGMAGQGIELDADEISKLHDENVPDDKKHAIVEALITSYYGEGRQGFDVRDILAKEWGLYEFWTLDQKAWLSDMAWKYDPTVEGKENDYSRAIVPVDGDIPLSEAISIARAFVMKEYSLVEGGLEGWLTISDFTYEPTATYNGQEKTRTYTIAFVPPGGIAEISEKGEYAVWLLNDGTVIHHEHTEPMIFDDTISQRFEDWLHLSNNNMVYEERLGLSKNYIVPDVSLWSVEGLALFAQEYAPKIKAAVSYDTQMSLLPVILAGIPYALPSEGDITPGAAVASANATIKKSFEWTDETLAILGAQPSISYRIAANGDGYWRIGYHIPFDNIHQMALWNEQARNGEIPWAGQVSINAQTGRVLSVEQYTEAFNWCFYGEFSADEHDAVQQESNVLQDSHG